MNKDLLGFIIITFFASIPFKIQATDKPSNSFSQMRTLFKNPPVEYRSAPLWVWNDDVTEPEIDQQLAELKAGGIGGVFIHPRPGLITPYLSERWFSLCRYTVDRCKELGMQVWLYDENSYPSGFAGGHVPAEMPESYNQGQGLMMHRKDTLPDEAKKKYDLILKKENSEFVDITDQADQEKNKTGEYYLFEKTYYQKSPWYGGFSYVDLLFEGVTEKFIDVTMTGYQKAIGDEFGKLVPGIFTDEPNIYPPRGIRWTPALFSTFQKRWGYDLKTNLPALFDEIGDWKRVRHNYYTTLLEMFIERWSKPWHQYCEAHDLKWTGHYWEHGWPNPNHCLDNMAMYAWHHVPAIDMLMNQYSEGVNAQFGNVRALKELRSVANQMGRTRTLSETYGAGGWDLRFEDMKRIGDWEYVLGVNFLNQHLSYITIKGARKRDHPQSFSYHDPWWKFYHLQGDYFARLSFALSAGDQINHILVIEPTTTAAMYFSPAQAHHQFGMIGQLFQNFVLELEKYQIEYDLGSENIIGSHGKIVDNQFVVGQRSYDVVVFPPGLENLDRPTVNLIKQYLQNGGSILSFVDIPHYIDGAESTEMKSIIEKYANQWSTVQSIVEPIALNMLTSEMIKFYQPEQIMGKLFHQRRQLTDGELLFLVNTSMAEWATGSFAMAGQSVIELDLITGELKPYPKKVSGSEVEIEFDLPPVGSVLLFINNSLSKDSHEKKPQAPTIKILTPADKLKIERIAPNVLLLDYCSLELNGKKEKDIYFFEATDRIFKHYGFAGNPWSSAVQYKSSIIDRDHFPEDSGFKATFSFSIKEGTDKSTLRAVVERPELWKLSINGKIVAPNSDESWLDRSFGVFDIGKNVVVGENQLTLIASPMTIHSELESIYILGNFGLAPQEKGWKIIPATPLFVGSWHKQGLPFYAEGISYTKTYHLQPGQKNYIIKLVDWQGSVADVRINDQPAGVISWHPYELDITKQITNGENKISVIVYGTLKNLLGPHHNGPVRGTAWPNLFQTAPENQPPGNEYDVIDYGLFEDFVLLECDGASQRVYWRDLQVMQPIITPQDSISIDKPVVVTLSTRTDGAEIRFTLAGNDPQQSSPLYTGPITIDKNCILKARSYQKGLIPSLLAQQSFYILDSKKNGLDYRYYEGLWQSVPDLNTLTAVKKGRVYEFNLDQIDRRPECFAVEFSGYIQITQSGEYTFYTESNDGSKLYIDDVEVVDNDGLHGTQEKRGKIKLKSGLHPIKVLYFDGGGTQNLTVRYQGPGIQKRVIPPYRLFHNNR